MIPSSDIAFTPTVKALQVERGSRAVYARMEENGGFQTDVTDDLAAFLETIDTAFLATANSLGQPYAQHRGGPKGFIHVVGKNTLAFADYAGNQQYISTGNLRENNKAFLFLMDYETRRRIKLWGRASVVSDKALIDRLMPQGYRARSDQAIVFDVDAWDVNCPQHIPRKIDASDVIRVVTPLQNRIKQLEAEIEALRRELKGKQT